MHLISLPQSIHVYTCLTSSYSQIFVGFRVDPRCVLIDILFRVFTKCDDIIDVLERGDEGLLRFVWLGWDGMGKGEGKMKLYFFWE